MSQHHLLRPQHVPDGVYAGHPCLQPFIHGDPSLGVGLHAVVLAQNGLDGILPGFSFG